MVPERCDFQGDSHYPSPRMEIIEHGSVRAIYLSELRPLGFTVAQFSANSG